MSSQVRPLRQSIILACIVFILLLGTVITAVNSIAFRKSLYERNLVYLTDLLRYIELTIDKDDLAECARTGKASETYDKLQTFLDAIVDTYSVDYVYVMKPLKIAPYDNVLCIINGITAYEYENMYDELYFFGDIPHEAYPESTMRIFFDAMERTDEITFFNRFCKAIDKPLCCLRFLKLVCNIGVYGFQI